MIKVKTEIYSRVSGYYRPVNQWNKGKQSEFADREFVNVPEEVKREDVVKIQLGVSDNAITSRRSFDVPAVV